MTKKKDHVVGSISEFNLFLYSNATKEPNPEADLTIALKALKKGAAGILIYDHPVSVMAAALDREQKAEDMLNIWVAQAAAHLTLYRKERQKIYVVERNKTPIVQKDFPDMSLPEALLAPLTPDDPLLYALASFCFDQHPSAQRLLAELRTSGQPSENIYAGPDLAAAVARYHQMASEQRNQLLMQENDSKQKAARLLQEQIIQLQATTEAYYRNSEAACQELDRLYASKSWRVTKPLRGLRRIVQTRWN